MFHDRKLTDTAEIIGAHLSRVQAGSKLTEAMVRRSQEQLALSYELLSGDVPKVGHPEQGHE